MPSRQGRPCYVILSEAPADLSDVADWREVEGSRKCLCYHAAKRRSHEELSLSTKNHKIRELPETAIKTEISPGSFDYAPIDQVSKNI
jgi:hypothetical protein